MEPELRRRSAWIAFGITLAASVVLATIVFLPMWEPILLAGILATVTHGPYQRLARRLRGRRRVAATLMTIALILLVLLPIAVVVSIAVREAIEAYEYIRSALERGGIDELIRRLPARFERAGRQLVEFLPDSDALSGGAGGTGLTVARILGDVMSSVSRFLFGGVLMLIAYYGLLVEGKQLLGWMADASPLRRRQTLELFHDFRIVSRSVLQSVVLTAAAQAFIASIGYLIAGVPQTIFFGLLTFFASFVPSLGTGIVALPLVAVLLLAGKIWQGIFLAAWSTMIVGLVDNLLKPLLAKSSMRLNGILVFFALVGGLLAFGPTGLLVGPLAVTFLLSMVRFGQREWFAPSDDGGP